MRSLFFQVSKVFNRAALLEDGRLTWVDAWPPQRTDPTHEVYWGQVQKVVNGTQAAFVDLGKGRTGFLSRRDLPPSFGMTAGTSIEVQLKAGTHLPVQVKKPAVEHKQWPISAELRLVGFFLVFLPGGKRISFSRDFEGDRERLSNRLARMNSANESGGWIVRSSAKDISLALLESEAHRLVERHQTLSGKYQGKIRRLFKPDPWMALLYQHAKGGLRSILVDDEELFTSLRDRLKEEYPALLDALKYHGERTSLFDTYKIESQLERSLSAKFWLPSGGYLHFRNTEAGVTIDVNSGKQTKGRGGQGVALRTNLETADALGQQIPLRNLTGLLFVDFIDLPDVTARKRVEKKLQQVLYRDGARCEFLPINRWGIAMIRRQRIGLDLQHIFQVPCGVCRGSGHRVRWEMTAMRLERTLRGGPEHVGEAKITVRCHPLFAEYLRGHGSRWLEPLALEQGFELAISEADDLVLDRFEIDLHPDG